MPSASSLEVAAMIHRILVPLDGSHLAEAALPHAVGVARAFGSEVILFRVSDNVGSLVDTVEWRLNQAEAAVYLDALSKRIDSVPVRTSEADGNPAEQIVTFARQEKIDLIALSTHGQGGLSDFSLSSTVHKITSGAGTSVLLVRPTGEPGVRALNDLTYERLLVPLDCSPRGDWAVHVAATLARAHGAELWNAHIVPVPEMARRSLRSRADTALAERVVEANRLAAEAYLQDVVKRFASRDLAMRTEVISSRRRVVDALDELIRREHIDLVILSAHGQSDSTRWPYGSVAGTLLQYGAGPFLVLQDVTSVEDPLKRAVHAREISFR
jgi:nucleotide-binding universal stress UspA family protein